MHVYVVGIARTGSTVLCHLLSEHPSVFNGGEITRLARWLREDRDCACGMAVSDCSFWRRLTGMPWIHEWLLSEMGLHLVRTQMQTGTGGLISDQAAAFRSGGSEPTDLEDVTLYVQVVREIASLSGADFIVDNSKSPSVGALTYAQNPTGTRIVIVVRDARGVVCSTVRRTGQSVTRLGLGWVFFYLKVRIMLRGVPRSQVRVVKYEALCRRPSSVVANVFEWLGVPSAPERHAATSHAIGGSDSALGPTGGLRRSDNRWRQELSLGQRALLAVLNWPVSLLLRRWTDA